MKYYFLPVLFLAVTFAHSQDESYNTFSFEAAYGMHAPITQSEFSNTSDYVGFGHFHIGARYHFTRKFGARVTYSQDRFTNDDASMGITYNRFGAEAVYNIGRHLFPYYIYHTLGTLAHAGVGYTRATPIDDVVTEQIANFSIGLRPQVKLNRSFALYMDATYILNLKQHFDFSGELFSPADQDRTASFTTLSLGVMVYLGNKTHHADWY